MRLMGQRTHYPLSLTPPNADLLKIRALNALGVSISEADPTLAPQLNLYLIADYHNNF